MHCVGEKVIQWCKPNNFYLAINKPNVVSLTLKTMRFMLTYLVELLNQDEAIQDSNLSFC